MKNQITLAFIFSVLQFGYPLQMAKACCAADDASLTEYLLADYHTIFLCKILKSHTSDNGHCSSEALIKELFSGSVDSNIVILNTGTLNSSTGGWVLEENSEWLIYTSGKGKVFGAGSICDRRSKKASDTQKFQKELEFIRIIIDLKNNKKTRKLNLVYANGTTAVIGQFVKGKPDGNWKHYYENGKLKTELNYRQSEFDGAYKTYSKEGMIMEDRFYEKGDVLMATTYTYDQWHPMKNIKISTFTQAGTLITTKKYFDTGQLALIYAILYKKKYTIMNMEGDWIKFYENGQIQETGRYENNKKIGVWESYSQDGTLTGKQNYSN